MLCGMVSGRGHGHLGPLNNRLLGVPTTSGAVLQRRVVVVTGANNGIGLGLMTALAVAGVVAVGLDLSTDNLTSQPAIVCDVTDTSQVEASVAAIIARHGRIDVLVNNACLAVFAPFEERSVDDTRRELEVNYFGYVNMIRAVLPHMRSAGGGVIHNISSTVGTTGFAGISGYASSKGAIEALTRCLALELREYGIAVNLIHPPLTRTASAAPLGVPPQFMDDPQRVGARLAPHIGSRRSLVTPGVAVALGVFMARLFPTAMGRLMSDRAAAARVGTDA